MANALDNLATLTYAVEAVDIDEVWRDIAAFRKRLWALVGERFPIATVIERGEKNGRLHVHFAFGRYLSKELVAKAWGLGWVDLRKIRTEGTGKRERCRRAASYISAYAKKGFTEGHEFARHRYEVTQGFQPVSRSATFQRRRTASAWWVLQLGSPATRTWSSDSCAEWEGPPVLVGYWDDP